MRGGNQEEIRSKRGRNGEEMKRKGGKKERRK